MIGKSEKAMGKFIDELKKKNPEEMTSRERSMANLNPIKKGEVRNPNGKKKGTQNWSTHFKKLMGDEEFLKTIISQLPREWDGIVGEIPADVIAAGLIATATQQVAKSIAEGKAVDENTLKVIDRISKIGYGESKHVSLNAEEEGFFEKVNFNFNVVKSDKHES